MTRCRPRLGPSFGEGGAEFFDVCACVLAGDCSFRFGGLLRRPAYPREALSELRAMHARALVSGARTARAFPRLLFAVRARLMLWSLKIREARVRVGRVCW